MVLAMTTVGQALIAATVVWVVAALLTATYGRDHGYPWAPLFISGLILGFAVVLLAVAIASRHQPVRPKGVSWLEPRHPEEERTRSA